MRKLFTCREADWLRSPIVWIPQFAAHFFHLHPWHLTSNLGVLFLLLPDMRSTMSLRRSIISFTLGGFLLLNLCCAVDRFITPIARLATWEIDLKLDSIARLQPSYASKKQADQDSKYWGEVHKITVRLKRQTVKMVNKEQNADLHAIQADYDLVQQVLLAIEERNNTHKYVMPTSASSL